MRGRKTSRLKNEPDAPVHKEEVKMEIKEEYNSDNEYRTEDEVPVPESEVLPGPKGQPMYYDGMGYYYNQLREDKTIRVLVCCHTGCGATAEMALYPGAPISLLGSSKCHNHPPNQSRRERLCFLQNIKTRHAAENIPFTVIFQEEAEKNPIGASFFSFDKIEKHLKKKLSESETVLEPTKGRIPARTIMKTRGRPSPQEEPLRKKAKKEVPAGTPGNLSKKLELLKSLQNIPSGADTNLSEGVDKPSERLPGPHPHAFVYYDGKGHYYKALSISDNTRYLKCTVNECLARAVMRLEDNSPISLEVYSPPHNHPPQPKENKRVKLDAPTSTPASSSTTNKSTTKTPTPRRTARKKTGVYRRASHSEFDSAKDTSLAMKVAEEEEEVTVKKYSEKLSGPEFYHDFKGNYYFTVRVKHGIRCLRCLVPTCQAEARMKLGDNAEIQPAKGSRPHNHLPDLDTRYCDKINQLENQWLEWVPSERLPSLSLQYCCYYDGKGFYFHQTTQKDNIRYLSCIESGCPVRAHMCTQKDAPISVTPLKPPHNHAPDYTLRDALLFIDAVRVRVRSDTEPRVAIQQETARNPVGAERVDLSMLESCLDFASEVSKNMSNKNVTEDEVDFTSCIKPLNSVSSKNSAESLLHVKNHFSTNALVLNNVEKKNKTAENGIFQENNISQDNKSQDNATKPTCIMSEKVPAMLLDSWLYHDGNGFYYCTRCITQDKRYLSCSVPKCEARGWMTLERGAPITLRRSHNHGPQPPHHLQELWFFHRLKLRAQREVDIPFSKIYREEATKNPEGAALISETEAINLLEKLFMFNVGTVEPSDMVNVPCTQPAEKLPAPQLDKEWHYHDGQGFYYIVDKHLKSNVMQ